MSSTKGQPDQTRPQNPGISEPSQKAKWPLKTLIEILPVVIALTVLFSYTTIKRNADVALFTPLTAVFEQVPVWVTVLMGLIFGVGVLGMGWLIFIFSRAPINHDSSNDH